MFAQLVANGLVTGSVIAIAAVGVSIVYGILRLVNFAYGDFMAFGALAAYAFNGPLKLSLVVSAILAMLATAALSLLLDAVLWRPLRRRRAGFMSLFLASIGLALVLRSTLLLAYGPQPQTYRVNPFKVYVIGSVRLSEAQAITIVAAAAIIVALGLFLSRTTLGRTMRALADDRTLAAVAGIDVGRTIAFTWILSGMLAGIAGILAGPRPDDVRPELRLHAPAADLRGGRARRHRQRVRRARRWPHTRGRDGALDLAVVLRRGQPDLQARCRVRRPHRRADGAAAGALRPGEGRMSALLSGEFWAFVGVVAGIYTILALGLQLQFGLTGLLNFGQVAFMAIGAYTMAILVVKEGMSMWLAAPLAIAAAAASGLLLGLTTLRLRADYFAIVTIAFSEIVRYVATNEESLTGGSQGTIALGSVTQASQYNGQWESFQARVGTWLHIGSKDVTMLLIVWAVAVVLLTVTWLAVRTPWGRVLRAIREDEDAAASLGKNVQLYKLQVLAIGSAFAGIAGLFYAWQFSFFSPDDFQPLLTFFAWMIVILGGLGRIWAVPVGALVFGFLFAGTRFLDFQPLSSLDSADRAYLRLIVIGLVIIGLVVFRPQGILGRREEMVLE